jgi:hypothetical protein
MTVAELIDYLSNFDPETKVVITYFCDNNFREIDNIRNTYSGELVVIESHEVPDFDDIQVMAREVLEEHGDDMSQVELRYMKAFVQ